MSSTLAEIFSFADYHGVELKHRLNCGWAAFHKNKSEFCNRNYPLMQRLRLFDAVVSSSVLYGSATWTMLREHELSVQTCQRRMLRYIVCAKWSGQAEGTESVDQLNSRETIDEQYWDYLSRTAHEIDVQMARSGIESWVMQQRRRLFRWAGQVSRAIDGRWSRRAMDWDPRFDGENFLRHAARDQGRPEKKWTDQMGKFNKDWRTLAANENQWMSLEEEFLNKLM